MSEFSIRNFKKIKKFVETYRDIIMQRSVALKRLNKFKKDLPVI